MYSYTIETSEATYTLEDLLGQPADLVTESMDNDELNEIYGELEVLADYLEENEIELDLVDEISYLMRQIDNELIYRGER